MYRVIISVFIGLLLIGCMHLNNPESSNDSAKNYSGNGTLPAENKPAGTSRPQVDTLKSYVSHSANVGDDFVIDISLPSSYSSSGSKKYPVIYLTDGNWRRPQHQPIHDMSKSDDVREMIVVGISYPDSYNPNSIRVRDLITHADNYLDFICSELIPYIEKNYRTDGLRTLWGSSYGGYFVMYALFQYTEKTKDVFQNYIVASPTCYQTTEYNGTNLDLFGYEEKLAANITELNLNLYMTVGGLEDSYWFIEPFKKLVARLEGRNYKGFYIKSFIDPGKDHMTVWEPTLYEGIRMFLKNEVTSVR